MFPSNLMRLYFALNYITVDIYNSGGGSKNYVALRI